MLSRWRAAALVAVVSSAYLAWLQFLTPWIVETDGYYHVKVAWLVRQHGPLKQFPWAAWSLWSEQFYDKEAAYHALLSLFTYGDLVTGAKLGAVAFGTAFFVSFFLVLRLSGVRHAAYWTIFLLLGSGGYFGWRVDVTRPQVLSMALALWSMSFVLREDLAGAFGISALYALSYTAPHVAVICAGFYALAQLVTNRRLVWQPVVATVAGVLAGWLVHPNFPANFLAFKVQIIDVLASAWGFSGPELHLGGEFSPPPRIPFIREHLAIWLALAAALWAWLRLRIRLEAREIALGLAALAWFLLTCRTKRFVEYFVPFTLWWCAMVLERSWDRLRIPRWVVVTLAAAVCARSVAEHRRVFLDPAPSREETAALWIRTNVPPGALVFTCDWDDAPELFFFDETHRYMVFLDPSYMYRWRPEVWRTWDAVANGREKHPVDVIRETFGARYGFCTNDFYRLRDQLQSDRRVSFPVNSVGGYVFELADK